MFWATSFRFRLIISARFRYSKIVQTFWCIVIFHLNRMEARHARQVWSNGADRRAWGAGSSRSLGIGERARSIGNRRCAELLATLIARAVSNLSAEHWPPPQQPRYGPGGDWRKSPERATRRPTSPSAHACSTPHCGKTPRRQAPHALAQSMPSRNWGPD